MSCLFFVVLIEMNGYMDCFDQLPQYSYVYQCLSSHKESWRAKIFPQEQKRRWGKRRLPKICSSAHNTQTSSGSKRSWKEFEDEHGWTSVEKAGHEWCESMVSHAVVDIDLQCQLKPSFLSKRRKLLQFDKSYRPAYYGSFSKMRFGF